MNPAAPALLAECPINVAHRVMMDLTTPLMDGGDGRPVCGE